MNIIIGLILLTIIYYLTRVNSQVCDGNSDCTIYNNQDKKSSCDPICKKQGKVYKDYIKGNCECENSVQLRIIDEHTTTSKTAPFIASLSDIGVELYTNISDDTTILPSNMPNDILFNNRYLLQKHEKDRYSSLIFG